MNEIRELLKNAGIIIEETDYNNIGIMHKECAEERRIVWQKENKNTEIVPGCSVKISFKERGEIEHMWVYVIDSILEDKFEGTIANDPVICQSLKFGDRITFNRNEIQQILFIKNK